MTKRTCPVAADQIERGRQLCPQQMRGNFYNLGLEEVLIDRSTPASACAVGMLLLALREGEDAGPDYWGNDFLRPAASICGGGVLSQIVIWNDLRGLTIDEIITRLRDGWEE